MRVKFEGTSNALIARVQSSQHSVITLEKGTIINPSELHQLEIRDPQSGQVVVTLREVELQTAQETDFSESGRNVIAKAREEAKELGHAKIRTEHLLLGLLAAGDSEVKDALERVGVSYQTAKEKIALWLEDEEKSSGESDLPLTNTLQNVLDCTLVQVRESGISEIEPVHLLLNLLDMVPGTLSGLSKDSRPRATYRIAIPLDDSELATEFLRRTAEE